MFAPAKLHLTGHGHVTALLLLGGGGYADAGGGQLAKVLVH